MKDPDSKLVNVQVDLLPWSLDGLFRKHRRPNETTLDETITLQKYDIQAVDFDSGPNDCRFFSSNRYF